MLAAQVVEVREGHSEDIAFTGARVAFRYVQRDERNGMVWGRRGGGGGGGGGAGVHIVGLRTSIPFSLAQVTLMPIHSFSFN